VDDSSLDPSDRNYVTDPKLRSYIETLIKPRQGVAQLPKATTRSASNQFDLRVAVQRKFIGFIDSGAVDESNSERRGAVLRVIDFIAIKDPKFLNDIIPKLSPVSLAFLILNRRAHLIDGKVSTEQWNQQSAQGVFDAYRAYKKMKEYRQNLSPEQSCIAAGGMMQNSKRCFCEGERVISLFTVTNCLSIPPYLSDFSEYVNTPEGESWLMDSKKSSLWLSSPAGRDLLRKPEIMEKLISRLPERTRTTELPAKIVQNISDNRIDFAIQHLKPTEFEKLTPDQVLKIPVQLLNSMPLKNLSALASQLTVEHLLSIGDDRFKQVLPRLTNEQLSHVQMRSPDKIVKILVEASFSPILNQPYGTARRILSVLSPEQQKGQQFPEF
jgi:hypothetical protein